MNADTWQQLKPLFHAALKLELDERDSYLENACEDEDVRRQVKALLAAHDAPGNFLVSPAMLGSITPDENIKGKRIGPYEIISEIGHGGMGSVFLAVRADDQYRKQVAIKLIKRGMDTDLILHRFTMERQILANLEHPNIARLLEGGSTTDGLPYFVMEYIEGQPIDEYCEDHNFTNEERLNLFRQVCAALQYAHQNLVVHRDIKPSNILVTSDGVPKLLDFGIAKLLSPDWLDATEATASVVRLMTPEYASPEQLRGLSITTCSDVYSLGVVMYELLTGRHPYRLLSRNPAEVADIVQSKEPEKPSSVASLEKTESQNGATLEESKTSSTLRNPRLLRGDLDNIVLKALRKEPVRRYASVQEFSEDIRRHLEGLPVTASPDTLTYRAGKFVRRHKAGVIAAVIVVMTMLTATVITTWQARVARRERNRAESRFMQVRKLANTVLFDYHERIKTLPGSTETQKKLVTDALEYLDNLAMDSDNSPDLQRELALAYEKVANIQGSNSASANTGETSAALVNYQKALGIQERLISQTQPTADDRRTLARLYVDVGSQWAVVDGNAQRQREFSERAAAMLTELVKQNPSNFIARSDLANTLYVLGVAKRSLNDLDGAFREFHEAEIIYEQLARDTTDNRSSYLRLASRSYKTHGGTLELKGDDAGALELHRKSVSIDAENVAANPNNFQYKLDLSFSYNSVASALTNLGNVTEALENCQKALAIQKKVVADDEKNVFAKIAVARTHRRMGDILARLERIDEASSNYKQAITMFESLVNADPNSLDLKARLGQIYSNYGNFLLSSANKPNDSNGNVQRLRQAQTFQKRGLEIFLALKAQHALDQVSETQLAEVQKGLQQAETELAKLSTR